MYDIKIQTQSKRTMADITEHVREAVAVSGIKEGICVVFAPHTTCGVMVNENSDSDVKQDILFGLERAVPNVDFKHVENNSDAHLMSAIVGSSQTIPISDGELKLGMWQAVHLVEFDGPRVRRIRIQCVGQ